MTFRPVLSCCLNCGLHIAEPSCAFEDSGKEKKIMYVTFLTRDDIFNCEAVEIVLHKSDRVDDLTRL